MSVEKSENTISTQLSDITHRQVALMDQENTDGEGWNYYCNGQVIYASVFRNELSGIVREYIQEFKVKIKIEEHEISCTCTCDSENLLCRHVVALLYSWVNDKDEFTDVGNFIEKLHNMDKTLLIEMVKRFVIDDPQNIRFLKEEKDLEVDN